MPPVNAERIVLLVHLQEVRAPSVSSSSSLTYGRLSHVTPSRSSLPPVSSIVGSSVARPSLLHENVTVSIDGSQPVHVLHSLIEVKYTQLLLQTIELELDIEEPVHDSRQRPSSPCSPPSRAASPASLSDTHHIRVRRLLKERVYAISKLDTVQDVLQDREPVVAEVVIKEGILPQLVCEQQQQRQKPRLSTKSEQRAVEEEKLPTEAAAPVAEQAAQEQGRHPASRSSQSVEAAPASSTEPAGSSSSFSTRASASVKRPQSVAEGEHKEQLGSAQPASSKGGEVPQAKHRKRKAAEEKQPESSRSPSSAPLVEEERTEETHRASTTGTHRASTTGTQRTSASAAKKRKTATLASSTLESSSSPAVSSSVPGGGELGAVECVLCRQGSGALKRTKEGGWCHLVCAKFVEGAELDWTTHLVQGVARALRVASRRLCEFCKLPRGTSAPIQCGEDYCRKVFHVTCAQQRGLQTAHVDFLDSETAELVAYCTKHAIDELREWSDDGCSICLFMRPNAREPSHKLTCITCGLQVHMTCYYGRDEELLSDSDGDHDAEQDGDLKEHDGFPKSPASVRANDGSNIQWGRWQCMCCDFLQHGCYRFPQLPSAAGMVKVESAVQAEPTGRRKAQVKRKQQGNTKTQEMSPGAGRGAAALKKKRGRTSNAKQKVDEQEEKEEAALATSNGQRTPLQLQPILSPVTVRGSVPASSTSASSTSAQTSSRPATVPANASVSGSSPSQVRYLSESVSSSTASSSSPSPSSDVRSPQTVLKTLKSSGQSASPREAPRAAFVSKVAALDLSNMRAILHHHGLSTQGSKSELIARLQASGVQLPSGEEAARWRSEWEDAIVLNDSQRDDERKDMPEAGAQEKKKSPSGNERPHQAVLAFASPDSLSKIDRSALQAEASADDEKEELERLQQKALELIDSASEGDTPAVDDGDDVESDSVAELPANGASLQALLSRGSSAVPSKRSRGRLSQPPNLHRTSSDQYSRTFSPAMFSPAKRGRGGARGGLQNGARRGRGRGRSAVIKGF